MIKHGGAWHLGELTGCLQESSKICVLNLCLDTIQKYESEKKESLDSKAKTKLTIDLLRVTKVESQRKFDLIDRYVKRECLTTEEGKKVKAQMERERIEMEEEQHRKEARAARNR